ncbi:MAG: hypothetical protein ACLTSZ_02850 [Lachnospiraceae bacterium]
MKSLGEVFVFPPTLFGEKIVWENYTKISSRFDYLAYFLKQRQGISVGCYFSGIYICDSRLCICKTEF